VTNSRHRIVNSDDAFMPRESIQGFAFICVHLRSSAFICGSIAFTSYFR